jgi:hypothetical protein
MYREGLEVRALHGVARPIGTRQVQGFLTVASSVHPDDMQPSKRKWKSTLTEVIGLLNDFDPYGLKPGTADGAPQDEYEPEASTIASFLLNTGSISRSQVEAIWQDWFQEPLSDVMGAAKAERFCVNLNSLNDSA